MPPPLTAALLVEMAVSMRVTTPKQEAVDDRVKSKLPPLPPFTAELLRSAAVCMRSVGSATPLIKPLVPGTDADAESAANDDTPQTKEAAPPPVTDTESTGQLELTEHAPARDESIAAPMMRTV